MGYVESFTTGKHNGGKSVTVRVYAPKGEERHGDFALKIATDTLEYFAEGRKKLNYRLCHALKFVLINALNILVFGIPYPLPKCDMVAIPDFEAGMIGSSSLRN